MNDRNLYTPPLSATVAEPGRARGPGGKRPISAWVLMAMLTLAVLGMVFGAARTAWMIAQSSRDIRHPLAMIGGSVVTACVLALLVTFILSIYRGRPVARWLGLAAIVGFSVLSVLRPDDTRYPNQAQEAGAAAAKYFMLPIVYLWWAYAFAFSAKARRYFSREPVDAA